MLLADGLAGRGNPLNMNYAPYLTIIINGRSGKIGEGMQSKKNHQKIKPSISPVIKRIVSKKSKF